MFYRAYTCGDRRRDCRSDRRRDEHLFNEATNWQSSRRRSPVVYTRGDSRGDDRHDNRRDDRSDLLRRRSPRVLSAYRSLITVGRYYLAFGSDADS